MKTKQRPRPRKLGAFDDPEWQEAKAARQNIGHADAVQQSVYIVNEFWSLWGSHMEPSPVSLNQVIRVLNAKKIPFVLIGAYSIGGWTGRPRATYDVDVLVKSGRNHARAVKAMRELYPGLEVKQFYGVTGFFLPGKKESVLDVIYPYSPNLADTLAAPIWLDDQQRKLRYRIQTLEQALANKYAAMVSLRRDPRKQSLDIADFGFMVKHSTDPGREPIDLEKLESLGDKVWPGGGGKEILRMVELAKADQPIQFDANGRLRVD